jgi:hypothetical protein
MLTLTGTDPLVASNWTKKSTPVFQSSGNVYGPGHNGFTKSIDGTEDWIVYHAAKYDNAGWDRSIRAQKFTWNADGTPNFGTPTSTDNAVTLPSGEVLDRTSYEAEDAALTDTQLVSKSTASGGSVVGHIDFADSAVEFTVHVPTAGDYRMYVRYDNGTAGDSTHNIAINGTSAGSITYTKTDAWLHPNIVTKLVTLQAGANTIKFTKGTGYAELDFIQISTLLYEGEDATFFDASVGPHTSASHEKVIGHIDFADSYVTFNVKAPTAGNYTMKVRYHNGMSVTSTHKVYVNGGTSSTINYPHFSSWNIQGTATMTVNLNAGNNTIKFMKGTSFAEIDYITITKQ